MRPLLHGGMRTLLGTVKKNFCRALEVNQGPATMRGMFIKVKELNLGESEALLSFHLL